MPPTHGLTASLEDYLETIYELHRERDYARVRDIAKARNVKAGSVSPAMKRLADLGLIRYVQRDYIGLTEAGLVSARRVYARHQLLTRFFGQILGLAGEEARKNACAMEHNLTPEAMDRLARFLEFTHVCPGGRHIVDLFNDCSIPDSADPIGFCHCGEEQTAPRVALKRVSDLAPGQVGTITRVSGTGAIRQRLLDMGILPNVPVEMERVAPGGDPMWIRMQGFQLSLRRSEADAVLVSPSA